MPEVSTAAPATTSTPAPSVSPKGTGSSSLPTPSGGKSTPSTPAGASRMTGAPETPPTTTPAAQAAEARRKYQLRIDGADQEVELTDTEIAVRLQREAGANARFQEAAEIKRQTLEAFKALKDNPIQALQDPVFGVDFEALAEQYIADRYRDQIRQAELAQASPEQRAALEQKMALEDAQKQLAEERAANAQLAQDREAWMQEQQDKVLRQEYETTFIAAMDKAGLPKNYETLYRMAEVMSIGLENGVELTPDQLASEVRGVVESRTRQLEQQIRGGLQGEALLSHLGEETVKAVLMAAKARLKASQPGETYQDIAANLPQTETLMRSIVPKSAFDDKDSRPKRQMQSAADFRRKFIR